MRAHECLGQFFFWAFIFTEMKDLFLLSVFLVGWVLGDLGRAAYNSYWAFNMCHCPKIFFFIYLDCNAHK